MDLLREYEFDCLSFIDQQYDDPHMKQIVNSLIEAEMKTFTPSDNLAYLNLKDPSNKYDSIHEKIAQNKSAFEKLDEKRYLAAGPLPGMDSDVQAWRSSVQNTKAQIVHQENRLMNLEIAEDRLSKLWLRSNEYLEKSANSLTKKTDDLVKQIREVHKSRHQLQQNAYPEIEKLIKKRDISMMNRLQCESQYVKVNNLLLEKGFDIEQHYKKQRELEARIQDPNNAEYNSTVREYEKINVSE